MTLEDALTGVPGGNYSAALGARCLSRPRLPGEFGLGAPEARCRALTLPGSLRDDLLLLLDALGRLRQQAPGLSKAPGTIAVWEWS
ncbi:MAG TPA: hypothetical protein VER55_13180 [Ardenticatenaceae bacterium]|nr:hypothetical protein [Ardenticatenaceae bacterium]